MYRQPDAVIGHSILRKIIGPDFFAAVACADHCFTFFSQRLLLFLHFDFVKPRAQYAHRFLTVLNLRFFVLATHDRISWDMCDAHGGVGRIDGLAAGAGRAESVNAQIFWINLDVHIFRFRQHSNRNCRSVHSSLLFRLRHPLHAMHSAFVFQPRVNTLPSMMAITSFSPPTPDSEVESTSTFHLCVSAYRVYMRNISAAKSVASSPPVPARISRMTFFSSLGSLGRSRSLISSSTAATRASSFSSSSCAS